MEVVYCDNCGFKIASDAFEAEVSEHATDGKKYCVKCAPLYKDTTTALQKVQSPSKSVGPDEPTGEFASVKESTAAQGVMKFYFCETCGKRITDKQILGGLGRDKKLKGVYCKDCAVGVMTLEFDAISEADLRKPIRKSGGNAMPLKNESSADSNPVKNASRSSISPADRTETRPLKLMVHTRHESQTGIKPFAAAVTVVAMLAVLGTFVLTSGSQSRKNLKEDHSPTSPNEVVKSQSIQPTRTSPIVEPPAVPSLHEANTPSVSNDVEDRAKIAFEVLQRFDGLADNDYAGQITRIDKFLDDYHDSFMSGRARTLRNELTAKITIPPPNEPLSVTSTTIPLPAAVDSVVAVQRMLQQTLTLLSQMDIPAAVRSVEQNQDTSADVRNTLKAALETLQKRESAWHGALVKNVGHKVRLETKAGFIEGTVLAIEGEALKIDKPLVIDGTVVGSASVIVAFADILPASRSAVAPLAAPASIDEWMGQALAAMAKQDFDAGQIALAHCDGHPLESSLNSLNAAGRATVQETKAQAIWRDIETRFAGKLTQSQATTLLADISRLETNFADADFLKKAANQQKIVAAKDELGRLVLGLDPRVVRLFKGKVTSHDPRTETIVLGYDFANKEQTEDFPGSIWLASGNAPGYWPGLSWKQGELFLFCMASENRLLHMPQFVSNTLNIQLDYFQDSRQWARVCDCSFIVWPELVR